MIIERKLFPIVFSLCCLIFGYSYCEEHKKEDAPVKLLSIGTGVFNIVHHNPPQEMLQLEYRSYFSFYPKFRPLVGALITSKASAYFYGGVALDIYLGRKVVITPSFAPGIYLQGKGRNLGFPLEFRSSMEISYVLAKQARIGAQFYHISNASLGNRNPGVEALVFFYSIPFGSKKSS